MLDFNDVRSTFGSMFLAGFECSTHRRSDGRRLDLVRATGHERWAVQDYEAISRLGIRAARDGARWHLIEKPDGRYDWSSFLPSFQAARVAGVKVIWDLFHYGWPDHLDIWSMHFIERFARFAGAIAQLVRDEGDSEPLYCPVNEISYFAWAGADVARMYPACHGRAGEFKRHLARASIAAAETIRAVDPRARFITAEPLIYVAENPEAPGAESYQLAQFEAVDMLTGRLAPELGGRPELIDIVGLNYYPDNQWYHRGSTIPLGHHAYQPLSGLLAQVHHRYGKPLLISETGAEGHSRPYWLYYVADQTRAAIQHGIPITGICLYPVLDYPSWDGHRLCHTGLLSGADDIGQRSIFVPLLDEIRRADAMLVASGARSATFQQLPESTAATRNG